MTPFLNEPHPFATGYYSARPAADPPPPSYPFGQRPPGAASAWPPTSPSGSVNRAQPAGRQAQAASSPAAGNSASTGVLRPDWSVLLGAGVGMRPSYMGSDNLEVAGLPIVDIRWRDTVFLKTSGGMTSRVGLGFNVLNQQGFRIGPMIEYYMGQDTGDEISGMNDVDGGAEVGLFAEYNFKPWKAEAVARYGVAGGNDGFLMTGGLTWTTKLGRDLILSLGADASFGDGNYMDSYFGVSAVEAARSGLAPYDPGWGVRDVGLNLKMVYPFYGNFRLIGTGRFNYLLDEAADSPVVDTAGEEAQFSFGLAIAYQF
ncbi:MAG: MipA/OmpV family protein [Rhodospirillales bacterium]|nr:MipA/OmpV family protein [Rhodospirillales bacterium]